MRYVVCDSFYRSWWVFGTTTKKHGSASFPSLSTDYTITIGGRKLLDNWEVFSPVNCSCGMSKQTNKRCNAVQAGKK